ncbi:MAG TPA: hemolysin III family protein [Hyphomicrobium sp.]|nr:hemolysin III family protein [Hyphomicrobium sp.]
MSHAFPIYTKGELIADGALHVIGVAASLIAAVTLTLLAVGVLPPHAVASVLIYGLGLLAVFVCSAAYHLVRRPRLKALLRRFDHAAIYVKIAATYTPFAAVKMGGLAGLGLLGAVWVIAAIGVFTRLLLPGQFVRTAYVLYLAQGWACLAALKPMIEAVPATAMALLLVGGILYTAGVAFHLWERLPYHNAIWHAFVLAASACHFAAVLDAVVL